MRKKRLPSHLRRKLSRKSRGQRLKRYLTPEQAERLVELESDWMPLPPLESLHEPKFRKWQPVGSRIRNRLASLVTWPVRVMVWLVLTIARPLERLARLAGRLK